MSDKLTNEQLDQVELHVRDNLERIARLQVIVRQAKLSGCIGMAVSASELLSRLERAQAIAFKHLSQAGRC